MPSQWKHWKVQIAQHAGNRFWGSGPNRSLLLHESSVCLKCRGRKGHVKMHFVIVFPHHKVFVPKWLLCVDIMGLLLPGTKRRSLKTRRERCSFFSPCQSSFGDILLVLYVLPPKHNNEVFSVLFS